MGDNFRQLGRWVRLEGVNSFTNLPSSEWSQGSHNKIYFNKNYLNKSYLNKSYPNINGIKKLAYVAVAIILPLYLPMTATAKTSSPTLAPQSSTETSTMPIVLAQTLDKPTIALNKAVLTNTATRHDPTISENTGDMPMADEEDEEDEGSGDEIKPAPNQKSDSPTHKNPTTPHSENHSDIIAALPKDADKLASSEVALGAISPATIQRFVKVVDTVRRNYVRPINDDTLFSNAITGVMANLDPYSEYLDAQAYNNLRLFTEGDMGSIGVKVQFDNTSQHWVFSEVLPESPAAKVGIQVGDYLHQINDNKLQETQTQQDINQLLSGIAGTQLKLVVSMQGRRKHLVVVQRSLVQQQSIEVKVNNGVAIIHIPIFQNNTQQQVMDALIKNNQPFSAVVLDLRNNPGGILTAAADIASLFMQNKTLVQVHNRTGLQETITTHGQAKLNTIPLVVLQNRYSASASEVLASSLQENGRAKILGETSYGKGSIQSVVPINDTEAVKLTVAHYLSGQGKKIDGVGIIPDLPLSAGELAWETQAVGYLLTQPRPLRYLLKSDSNIQAF